MARADAELPRGRLQDMTRRGHYRPPLDVAFGYAQFPERGGRIISTVLQLLYCTRKRREWTDDPLRARIKRLIRSSRKH